MKIHFCILLFLQSILLADTAIISGPLILPGLILVKNVFDYANSARKAIVTGKIVANAVKESESLKEFLINLDPNAIHRDLVEGNHFSFPRLSESLTETANVWLNQAILK